MVNAKNLSMSLIPTELSITRVLEMDMAATEYHFGPIIGYILPTGAST